MYRGKNTTDIVYIFEIHQVPCLVGLGPRLWIMLPSILDSLPMSKAWESPEVKFPWSHHFQSGTMEILKWRLTKDFQELDKPEAHCKKNISRMR